MNPAIMLACSLLVVEPGVGEVVQTFSGETMGTTFEVQLVTDLSPERVAAVNRQLTAALGRVDELASTWRDDSELQAFNHFEGGAPFALSAELFELLSTAATVSCESGGAFDVTVGPLVDAWGFGPAGPPRSAPDSHALRAVRAATGWQLVELDPERRTARKANVAVRCDLSAIAKGHAVDRVAQALGDLGLDRYLVEIGGEVRARGHGPSGGAWQVAVERPDSSGRAIDHVIRLDDSSLATSGDYRRYLETGVGRYSHVLDPRTGRPIEHATASVTVMHARCAIADAWATALLVMGAAEGQSVASERGLAALFLVRDGSGGFRSFATPRWEEAVAQAE